MRLVIPSFFFLQGLFLLLSQVEKRSELKANSVKLENETVDRIVDNVCSQKGYDCR